MSFKYKLCHYSFKLDLNKKRFPLQYQKVDVSKPNYLKTDALIFIADVDTMFNINCKRF